MFCTVNTYIVFYVSKPLVIPIYQRTTCIKMVFFRMDTCVLKDILYKHHNIPVLLNSVENSQ